MGTHQDLGRHVEGRAAEGLRHGVRSELPHEAEVSDLRGGVGGSIVVVKGVKGACESRWRR